MRFDGPKLGELVRNPGIRRDAVHVAIVPMIAAQDLEPGERVGWAGTGEGYAGRGGEAIGIVDPFLPGPVFQGERFWVLLFPGTVTAMRHVWSHPAFPSETPDDETAAASEKWLRAYAGENRTSYDDMIAQAVKKGGGLRDLRGGSAGRDLCRRGGVLAPRRERHGPPFRS